jgi:hypothetical protein
LFVYLSCLESSSSFDCSISSRSERIHHFYVFLQFCLLLSVYASSIYQLHLQSQRQFTGLTILSLFVWFCFFTRCLYCLAACIGAIIAIEIGGNAGGTKEISLFPFCLLLFWEVLPMLLFLLYFRHIPATRASLHDTGVLMRNENNRKFKSTSNQQSQPSGSAYNLIHEEDGGMEYSGLLNGKLSSRYVSNSSYPINGDLDQELLAEYYGYNGFTGTEILNNNDETNNEVDSIFHPFRIPPVSYHSVPGDSHHYHLGSPLPDSYAAFDGPLDVDPSLIPSFNSHLFASNIYSSVNDQYFRPLNGETSVSQTTVATVLNPDAPTVPVSIGRSSKGSSMSKPTSDLLYGDNGVHSASDHE